ncbi:MAG: metal-dependent transcriptional regulator [Nanoarchaeota archaeon]|nr:MAG: metal-dependent transcriptional regulator [Nanoarchaeota archaeon]
MVSTAIEDYVRAVYILGERGKPFVSDVASYLGLTKASTSEMVKRLAEQGYLLHEPYSELKLTKKGKQLAEKLTYKHRTIELFLNRVLKLPKEKLHEEAHKLEHAFSDDSVRRMRRIVKNAKSCPHGQPIPSLKNSGA